MVDILRDLNIEIKKGETFGLVGASGSGKSTAIMVIAGLEAVTSGTVSVAGHVLNEMNEDQLAVFRRDNIGIIFQSFHLIATMTALENVAVPLELAGRDDPMTQAAEILERVGLGARLHHHPSQLSGGEQQRVAIARAIVAGAKLILADEPTGNLDSQTGASIIELLFSLQRENNITLLLVTHDDNLAKRCDRVGVLEDGQLVKITEAGAKKRRPARRKSGAKR